MSTGRSGEADPQCFEVLGDACIDSLPVSGGQRVVGLAGSLVSSRWLFRKAQPRLRRPVRRRPRVLSSAAGVARYRSRPGDRLGPETPSILNAAPTNIKLRCALVALPVGRGQRHPGRGERGGGAGVGAHRAAQQSPCGRGGWRRCGSAPTSSARSPSPTLRHAPHTALAIELNVHRLQECWISVRDAAPPGTVRGVANT